MITGLKDDIKTFLDASRAAAESWARVRWPEVDAYVIRVFREEDGRYACEYTTGDGLYVGFSGYSATAVGALAELAKMLIFVEEDKRAQQGDQS